jgi:PhzF family phenazine biosynthesis protein
MRTRIFQLDAFASRLFAGNPAAVMPLARFPDDALLQALAAENNLSETAFLVPQSGDYRLRWFTPVTEVPLCGHATLASAAVVMQRLEPGRDVVVFHSASGPLAVRREASDYVMDFPARPAAPLAPPPPLLQALGCTVLAGLETYVNDTSYMVVLDSAASVRALAPDLAAVARLDRGSVIVTAPGEGDYDFVSRFFAPAKGVPEDPVTGSAHCTLVPYWSRRLGRERLHAHQASRRGGELRCRLLGERVEIAGRCVLYLEGEAEIPEAVQGAR